MSNIFEHDDILGKVKEPVRAQIPRHMRAEIVIKIARGESMRVIARKTGINFNSVLSIKKDNTELIGQIRSRLTEEMLKCEENIMFGYLQLLDKKIDIWEEDKELFAKVRPTEISSVIKDLS